MATGRLAMVDLFAGAGGLSLGFAAAGFRPVLAVECDPDAATTYACAHPGTELRTGDIAEVDLTPWRGRVDLVAGGPPCQPWSLGGLRRGRSDPRDGIPQFLRAVEEVRPRAVVMENVAGLTRGAARPAFDDVLAALAALGYAVDHRVVQAADHGVPQRRERCFVVGLDPTCAPLAWPEPTHGPGRRHPHRAVGDVVAAEPDGPANRSIVTYARRPSLRPDPYHGQVFNGGGRPLDLGRPAPTLLASMGGNKTPWVDRDGIVPDYHRHLVDGGPPRAGTVPGARRITVAEAAAIQTFPASMAFAGPRSSQYRQVGNAVPPLLAEVVARAVRASLQARL